MDGPTSPDIVKGIKAPEQSGTKSAEIKKVDNQLGKNEQGIVKRIAKAGNPDLVLKDIAQGITTAKSEIQVTKGLPVQVEAGRKNGLQLPPEKPTDPKSLDQQPNQAVPSAKVEADKTKPQPEAQAAFDPKKHADYIREQIAAGLLDPDTIKLLTQISPDQRKQFLGQLSKIAGPAAMPQVRALPDLVRGIMADKPLPALKPLKEAFDQLPKGTQQFTPEEMTALFKDFSTQYYQKLEERLSASAVLGLNPEDVSPESIKIRSQQLQTALREGVMASSLVDFERFLVNRSDAKLKAELQKRNNGQSKGTPKRPEIPPDTSG